MEFNDWLAEYKLIINKVDEHVFEIEEVGKFLLIYGIENKIINKHFQFLFSDEDFRRADKVAPDFFCYQFGHNWYYSKVLKKVDKNSVPTYDVEMKMLKNIGKTEQDIEFCHLGIHSEYEILSGNGDLEDWVKKAEFLKHKYIGICDKNTLAGSLALQAHCEKAKMKSIIGETVTVSFAHEGETITEDIKLYVENELGWRNLLRINKQINVDNADNRCIDKSVLLTFTEGLILVYCRDSMIYKMNDYNKIVKYIKSYDKFKKKYFQVDSVEFISDETDVRNLNLLSFYFNNYCDILPPVLINDSYYIDRNNSNVKNYIDSITRTANPKSFTQYYKTGTESVESLYPLFDESKSYCGLSSDDLIFAMINNTVVIAEACNYKIDTGNHKLPKYDSGKDNVDLFFELIQEGIEKKLIDVDMEVYMARIEKECDIIVKSGFIDYFLILWDFVKWSKENDIMVGTGRGSVAGCLIAFLLDITTIDPLKHDLLFERFMNEARMSGERAKAADAMPDVDVDFLSDRREEVKRYISERFGEHNTCSIGAYTTMKLKGALKDFSRAKGLDFKYVNFITSKIPHQLDYEWQDLFKYAASNDVLKEFIQKNNDIIDVIQYTLKQPRAISVHASAVLITPKQNAKGEEMTVFDWMPIRLVNGVLVSEWEGKYIDKAGFLKEDILALNTLDKFKMTLRLIKRDCNKTIVFEELPLDDEETYKLFKKGYNEDVFQFGSHGLKQYSKLVKPDNIEELIAMNALYRPGPMKSNAHIDFADIKFGRKKPDYDYMLEEVTKDTYGLYIYQEQIMKAVHVLGGLSLVESDEIRTTIKKFDKVKLKSFEEKFIAGSIKNGCDPQEAATIWQKLLAFSGYGFNKSHSAAYSLMSYWCQYLKAHYPLQYWTTTLDKSNEEDIANILMEMSKVSKSITVVPPNINKSGVQFDCDKNTKSIYWSLSKIKGLAESSVQHIIDVRKNGQFKDMKDFITRITKSKVNKAKIYGLIMAGCFDEMYGVELESPSQRSGILLEYVDLSGNDELLDNIDIEMADKEFYWKIKQKELTGLGFIDYESIVRSKIKKRNAIFYTTPQEFMAMKKDYERCFVAGIVRNVYERNSKRGKFAFIELDNNDFIIEGNVWNETYKDWIDELPKLKGKMIALNAVVKYDTYNNRNKNIFHTNEFTTIYKL